MNPTCGWYLNSLQYARLVFDYLSGNIPDDCSGMNTEQPAAACSCIRQAAVLFTKKVQPPLSDADSRYYFQACPNAHRSNC